MIARRSPGQVVNQFWYVDKMTAKEAMNKLVAAARTR